MRDERLGPYLPRSIVLALEIHAKLKELGLPFSNAVKIGEALNNNYKFSLFVDHYDGTVEELIFPGDFKSGNPKLESDDE